MAVALNDRYLFLNINDSRKNIVLCPERAAADKKLLSIKNCAKSLKHYFM